MSNPGAGYYDDDNLMYDDDYSLDDNSPMLNDIITTFDVDEMMHEEGMLSLEDEMGSGGTCGGDFDPSPLQREFKVGDDLAAQVALDSENFMVEDVSDQIEVSDEIQAQIYELLKSEEIVTQPEAFDTLHIAIVNAIAKSSFDAAMYEAGGFLPDQENDWMDMVIQIKENQALDMSHLIAGILTTYIPDVSTLIEQFGQSAEKVAWTYAAQIRAVIHYMHIRRTHDPDELEEAYKVLSMLGDLAAQITHNEVLTFEERQSLSLRMKNSHESAVTDAYEVLKNHAPIVKAVFTADISE